VCKVESMIKRKINVEIIADADLPLFLSGQASLLIWDSLQANV
jgi:hypothetical protein